LGSSQSDISSKDKAILSVLNTLYLKQIPPIFISSILSKLNYKYNDERLTNYFFKKYFDIKIGRYSYGTVQILESNLKTLDSRGSFCSIANNLMLTGFNHPIHTFTTSRIYFTSRFGFTEKDSKIEEVHPNNRKIVIENDVWIGARVTILPSVKICNGAIIGAGALVQKDVPPYAIVGGVPAHIIKYRFSDCIIERLQESKWWEWEFSKIKSLCKVLYYTDTDNVDYERLILNSLSQP
jgi:virginiamycin A acetyltransferase